MAEIEELRAKVMASMPLKNATSTGAATAEAVPTPAADPNPNPAPTVPKLPSSCKEDGEISSSSSGDLFVCPPTQSDVEASVLPSDVGLTGKQTHNPARARFPGSRVSSVPPLRSTTVQNRMPTNQKYNKKTNPFQYKSGRNSWIAPAGSNDNLVIRFSDDDTDSDSEDPKVGDASGKNCETGVTGISYKPSTASQRLKPSHNTASSELQTTGNRGLTNHSSVSTVAKAKGIFHKIPGIPVPGKNLRFQKQNSSKKLLPSINQEFVSELSEKRPENLLPETDILENRRFPKNINQNKRKTLDIHGYTQGPISKNISRNATRFDGLASSGKDNLATVDHCLKRQKVCEHSQAKFSIEELTRVPQPVKQQDDETRRKITGDICHDDSDVGKQQCKITGDICHEDSDVGKQQCEFSSLVQTDLRSILRQKETNNTVSLEGSAIYAAPNWRNSTLDSHHYAHDVSCGSDQLDRTMQATSFGLVQDAQLQHLSIRANNATNHQKSSETLEATPGMVHFQSNPFICMGREIDIESLMNLEEIKDKELEEAQEDRRKCELEERRALKAYRKAQRDLISANEKCSLLYRARELFSAQLRAYVMEGSNSLWSSRSLGNIGTAFNSVESRENEIHRPSLGCEVQTKNNIDAVQSQYRTGPREVTSDTECRDSIGNKSSQLCVHASNLRSKQYLEPDINVSHPEYVTSQLFGEEVGEKMVSVDVVSKMPPDNSHDYELEANLRSKLFERLRKKSAVGSHDLNVKVTDSFDEADGISFDHPKKLSSVIHVQVYEDNGEKVPDDNLEIPRCSSQGINRWQLETRVSNGKASAEIPCAQKEAWDASLPSFNSVPSAALMVASSNLKQILLELTKEPDEIPIAPVRSSKDVATEFQTTSNLICVESFVYDGAIDPFWPFCMFELRGKCNNEECSMQHLKTCSSSSQALINNQIPPTSGVRQCPITSLSGPVGMNKASQRPCAKKLFIPSYRIGSIPMKTEVQQAGILLAQSNWLYWQVWFCTSFPSPISIQRLPLDVPTLQEADSRTDYENNAKRLFANLHSPDDETLLHVDIEHCLDVAFYHFNSQPNKPAGRRKALSVLSRALEGNPESSVLWIVYLHIYYGKEKELGKDDMFMHAVQNSRDSYELWLMYINSRMQLQSRMNAYDEALSVLCHKIDLCDMEKQSASSCVLDLFLQMINFLCMSGNVETAISRILDLPNAPNSILPDILSFLIFTDRCIFWVCCVYLVVYKKLPQVIVHQFEFEKQIPFGIVWPSIKLTDTEKQHALETMKVALDSVDVNIESRIDKSESFDNPYLRSLHFLAVTHVEFVMATEGLEGVASLLDEYISKYPTCVELYVLKGNCQRLSHNGFGFEIFQQALDNWPAGTPGIHCLWNQYVSYALDCNKIDVARELIDRWLSCYSGCQDPKLLDGNDDLSNSAHFILVSPEAHGYFSSSDDATFKLLNHWLHAVLQKVKDKARQVIDEALKEVSPRLFKHCVREHAVFCHTTAACSSSVSVPMLLSYLRDIRAPSTPLPLSRKFCSNIKKPRVRLLINKLLGPVSLDCSLMNSILEECYGPSLLPEKFNEPKDLVDYIEALVDISPANYKLAISAFRLVAKSFKCIDAAFYGLMFWASSILLNSLLQAFPVAPEQAWLEVAGLLSIVKIPSICERFYQHALSVYPFSTGLWKSYYRLSKLHGDCSHVIEAARIRGFELT